MPGKYKDLIMDIATEEVGHVEMIATMVARLLEGAPATATTKAAAADPVSARCSTGWIRSSHRRRGGRCCAGRGRTRLVVFMLPTCSRG